MIHASLSFVSSITRYLDMRVTELDDIRPLRCVCCAHEDYALHPVTRTFFSQSKGQPV
jgi:hypothetical protein